MPVRIALLLALLALLAASRGHAAGIDAAELVPGHARSGYHFQAEQTRAMQDDPLRNPGLLWVSQGEALWREAPATGPACAGCHGDASQSMHGVAARYPAIDGHGERLMNLEHRINDCRVRRQRLAPLAWESEGLLALTAFVAHQSRGMPLEVSVDGPAREWFERGRDLYALRQGQLNLACRHCHQQNVGRKLRGETVSQGHPVGYPAYRLQWQGLGSLHRRLRACAAGVRAVMPELGSDDYLALELFLAWRARGLALETPGVRR